jgi:sarcosine oxidase
VHVVVVGAGAWGLPAGAELALRGHRVTVVDAYGVGNAVSSSGGPTRLWRLAHPEAREVRLAVRSVQAWQRLEAWLGRSLRDQPGLLWRGDDAVDVAAALEAERIPYELLEPGDVDRRFERLRPNDHPAVWQPEAGPVHAHVALAAQAARLEQAGGAVLTGRLVTAVMVSAAGVRLELATADPARPGVAGETAGSIDADACVLAPGPYAGPLVGPLLAAVGVELALAPVLEQVTYVTGRPYWESLPCLVDGATRDRSAFLYAMPTAGLGYKIGIEEYPQRTFVVGDPDRSPTGAADRAAVTYAGEVLGFEDPRVTTSTVCSWTHAPDDAFVVDRVGEWPVVVACGDSGRGFKFSALMGEWLADLVEDRPVDADQRAYGLGRFGTGGAVSRR